MSSAVFAVPGALLGQRFGPRYVGAAGALLFALGSLWLVTHAGLEPNYASDLLPGGLIGGAGVGLSCRRCRRRPRSPCRRRALPPAPPCWG